MSRKIAPIIENFICQVRYANGYRYLDRCGQTIIDLIKQDPGWLPGDVNPQAGALVHLVEPMQLEFNAESMTLVVRKDLVTTKRDIVLQTLVASFRTIIDNLGLSNCIRFGARFINLIPVLDESEGEAKIKIRKLKLVQPSDKLCEKFPFPVKKESFVLVFEDPDGQNGYRLEVNNVRRETGSLPKEILKKEPRTLSKNQRRLFVERLASERAYREDPRYAVQVDLDCFTFDPEFDSVEAFVLQSIGQNQTVLDMVKL